MIAATAVQDSVSAAVARALQGGSALHAVGPQSGRIAGLWWFMLIVSAIVYAAVVIALAVALWRSRSHEPEVPEQESHTTRRQLLAIGTAVTLTVGTLGVFLVYSFVVGRAEGHFADQANPLRIEVTGHQWWWEVRYPDTVAASTFTTANEIHVPVGRPVQLTMRSVDVIHSFWVPALNGKKDLVPGYVDTTAFEADSAGVYRGQCAEFCGFQHAKMALVVVADPPGAFDGWLAGQRSAAVPVSDSVRARGQQVFLGNTCAVCHNIGGTPASATAGPDLTHVGGRLTLAAGALPNTIPALERWISDPQGVKPGTQMPPAALSRDDLAALTTYLQSLK